MKLVKLIVLSILYVITVPLILLVTFLFDGAMTLWRYLVRETTEEGDANRESYSRAIDRLQDLVDTYRL